MKKRRLVSIIFLFGFFTVFSAAAEPLHSPTWGFSLDLPEGYEFSGGDGKNSFSFASSFGAFVDISVYTGKASPAALMDELEKKLSARAEKQTFSYHEKNALIASLDFPKPGGKERFSGWALCVELTAPGSRPLLLLTAYGPPGDALQNFHLSALDSLVPGQEDRLLPGPVTVFSFPSEDWASFPLAGLKEKALFHKEDAEAAQDLVDREFSVLKRYAGSPLWREAWKRFYRAVYRDSFDRLKNAAFTLERIWNAEIEAEPHKEGRTAAGFSGPRGKAARELAEKALNWVQHFTYERDLLGSDFVNLVSAAVEGRGDCDSRAMLWAIILEQADIPSAIMVSREYGHAMGLADLEGEGARFPLKEGGREFRWMVAETTAHVPAGRIAEKTSEISKWLGITFF